MLLSQEEKLMISQYTQDVFHGQTVRQQIPRCKCGREISEKELYEVPGVVFTKIEVFGKTYTLIEPICPVCAKKIPAVYYVLN